MKTDSAFVAENLAAVPGAWRERVSKIYAGRMSAASLVESGTGKRSAAEAAANIWLADTADSMRAIRIPLSLSDAELCQMARECAVAAFDLAARPGTVTDTATLRASMAGFVSRYGITPPDTVTDTGAIKRMGDDIWWRRRLRVAQGRALERMAISLGYVSKKREIYASTATVERRAQQKKRNADSLERTVAVNQYGDEFTLAELAERAVSNPRIRRGELMTRIAGFESVARSLDHVGVFLTQTCPSRMHRKKTNKATKAVFDNPKFDGTTPRTAQQYLVKTWQKIRAALARAKVAVYGFRIAEPHHDATPHWHLLLFMAAEAKATVCRIFAKYARQADAEEMTTPEARKARFLVKVIDWKRGTAAGYIAKYVSKNIDGGGYQVQGDIHGTGYEAITPSHRVEAWAAAWGIRQFQQIGGAPVRVWRELRRLKADAEHSETLSAARSAADTGNWHRYTEVMGGPTARRDARPITVACTEPGERIAGDTGKIKAAPLTRYGEIAEKAVFGVRDCANDRAFVTRVFQWEVKRNASNQKDWDRVGRAAIEGAGINYGRPGSDEAIWDGLVADNKPGWAAMGSRSGILPEQLSGSVGSVSGLAGLARPWTRVNNCTEDTDYDFSGQGAFVPREGEARYLCAKFGADPESGKGNHRRNGGDSGRTGKPGARPERRAA